MANKYLTQIEKQANVYTDMAKIYGGGILGGMAGGTAGRAVDKKIHGKKYDEKKHLIGKSFGTAMGVISGMALGAGGGRILANKIGRKAQELKGAYQARKAIGQSKATFAKGEASHAANAKNDPKFQSFMKKIQDVQNKKK
jgi:hypothetical protein